MSGWLKGKDDDFYTFQDGSKRARVTRIISTLSKAEVLDPWRARLAAEFAVQEYDQWKDLSEAEAVLLIKETATRYTTKTASLGTLVHGCVEKQILGLELSEDEQKQAKGHLKQFAEFEAAFAPVWLANEIFCWDGASAGTADGIVSLDLGQGKGPQTYILDIKTGKSVHAESVALQLSSYRYMQWALVDGERTPMPEVDGGLVLHLRPRSWSLVEVICDERVKARYDLCVALHRWANVESLTVMGEKLRAPGQ